MPMSTILGLEYITINGFVTVITGVCRIYALGLFLKVDVFETLNSNPNINRTYIRKAQICNVYTVARHFYVTLKIHSLIPGISDRAPWALFRKIALSVLSFLPKERPWAVFRKEWALFRKQI